MILTVLKLHSPRGSCNFENCQNHSYLLITNCTRGRAISYTNTGHIWYFGVTIFGSLRSTVGNGEVNNKGEGHFVKLIVACIQQTINTPLLPPKNLHRHCFRFLLGHLHVPRESEYNHCVKFFFWGGGWKSTNHSPLS